MIHQTETEFAVLLRVQFFCMPFFLMPECLYNHYYFWSSRIVRLMPMSWTWWNFQMDSASSLMSQLHLLDVSSAPKLWALMRDTTSLTSTNMQKVLSFWCSLIVWTHVYQTKKTVMSNCDSDCLQAQRRRGGCMKRLNTTTSCNSEEKSQDSKSRCLLLFTHFQRVPQIL